MSLEDSKMSANKLWLICTTLLMISGCAMQQMAVVASPQLRCQTPHHPRHLLWWSIVSILTNSVLIILVFIFILAIIWINEFLWWCIVSASSQPQTSGSDGAQGSSDSNSQASTGSNASNLELDPNKANRAQHQVWHLQTHLKLVLRKQERRAQIWVQCHQVNLHPVSLMNLWGCLTKRSQVKESSLHLPEKVLGG